MFDSKTCQLFNTDTHKCSAGDAVRFQEIMGKTVNSLRSLMGKTVNSLRSLMGKQ